MKGFIFYYLLISFISFNVMAETQVLSTERGSISIPKLKDWELGERLFGMPFLYFSPQKNSQRSNISFTATGVDEIDLNNLSRNSESYKKIKNEWAQTVSAQATAFIPYKSWKNSQGHTVHEIGFEFLHEGKNYIEKSYYIACRGQLIYTKSLRLKENILHVTDFENLIKELDCGQ